MRLTDSRCEEIKEIIVDLFVSLNIKCVPISGFEIATKLDVSVVPYSSKDERSQSLMLQRSNNGFCVLRDGKWYIFYNDKKNYGRINNTIIHECGHIVLVHTEDSELTETEAKFFAKYAIAPPPLIHKIELKNAYEVYSTFDISLEAAEYSFSYYEKWLRYGCDDYTPYEKRMLRQFDIAV